MFDDRGSWECIILLSGDYLFSWTLPKTIAVEKTVGDINHSGQYFSNVANFNGWCNSKNHNTAFIHLSCDRGHYRKK